MAELGTVLVIDDNAVNRKILCKLLSQEYLTIEANNGQMALDKLSECYNDVVAILLDIIMPVMDGYAFLDIMKQKEVYHNIPIVVITGNSGNENEIKALQHGAWDFVSKPYNADIIKFRLKNVIARSQLSAFKQLKYLAEYDTLTGIYNRHKFFQETHQMLMNNKDKSFMFIRFDIDRFQLVNSFYGMNEGDNLLKYIAEELRSFFVDKTCYTYGRIEADIFAVCMLYHTKESRNIVQMARKKLAAYNPNYDIVPSFGIYMIEDPMEDVNKMYDKASLAARTCKRSYTNVYSVYTSSMSEDIVREQEMINEMQGALDRKEFIVYLQPKYNLRTNHVAGAEALVRWNHPQKGLVSPGVFIPVFERNGFISHLDYYVWETVCQLLHKWIQEGIKPYPISVNVSRVHLYNPQLVQNLEDLVQKYSVPPELLNLELTESAYADNPTVMCDAMKKLQKKGFIIMMDDFGSEYSSLNILKDIEVDILKIDMQFLAKTDIPGRGENIIASVIRMAKWLRIPVIAEGAERKEQVDFLRSVGCDCVQGYYFSKPIPVEKYQELLSTSPVFKDVIMEQDDFNTNALWISNPEMEMMFNNVLQAIAIYEYDPEANNIEIMRVNTAFYDMFGYDDTALKCEEPIRELIDINYQEEVKDTFYRTAISKDKDECDYLRICMNGETKWIHVKLKYMNKIGEKYLIFGSLNDITAQKELDNELQKYRAAITSKESQYHNTMLIIDNIARNRIALKEIFSNRFDIIEAKDGNEALSILKNGHYIDIVLLDLAMSHVDAKRFLQNKRLVPSFANIPVIIITEDDCPDQQIRILALGAEDYIVKPFVAEVVMRRVMNVLESNRRYNDMLKEYHVAVKQAKIDPLTGAYNRETAETLVNNILGIAKQYHHAGLMIDIDNFKSIKKTYGYEISNNILKSVTDVLLEIFHKNDIIARVGEDKFFVFNTNALSHKQALDYYKTICKKVQLIHIDEISLTCSVGVSFTCESGVSFNDIYQKADKALYMAKGKGKNNCQLYREDY